MASKLRFNPGFQTDDEAVSNYVVRRAELAQALAAFDPTSSNPTPRVLVTAPRGAGKTTLCRRVLAETRRVEPLQSAWQAIFLGEESYSVTTPGEFFLECLFQLADQTADAGLQAAHDHALGLQDESELLRGCLDALGAHAAVVGKRLLIIVENFHTILHDQIGDEAASLLAELGNDQLFGMLATSVAQSSAEDEGRLPADYVRIDLQPLGLEECRALWQSLTGATVKSDRIRPLQILTGGSPRLLHILADFMRTPSLQDLLGNLNLLIDQNTEYFKSQLDALPPMERKVFAALLDAWDPRTAKQIGEAARVNTNTASAMLSRLSERGSVVKAAGSGRSAIYYAAERLFNIYYLMRRRSHPSSRVRALVSFMTEYYESEELVNTTTILAHEACTVAPERRADYHSTYSQIISQAPESVRQMIIEKTHVEFMMSFREEQSTGAQYHWRPDGSVADEDLSKEIAELENRVDTAIDADDYAQAKELFEEILAKKPSASAWARLSMLHRRNRDYSQAVEAARRALELDSTDPWAPALLGSSLRRADREAEALSPLQDALKLDPAQPLALLELSDYWQEKGQPDMALTLLEEAGRTASLPDWIEIRRASLLLEKGQRDRARSLLRAKVDEGDDNFESRRFLARLLDEDQETDVAVEILKEAAGRFNSWQRWADVGSFLHKHTDRDGEAAAAFRTSLALGGDEIYIYRRLAFAMAHAGEPADEIAEVRETLLGKYGEAPDAWAAASAINSHLGNLHRAEEDLRKAIELGGADSMRRQLSDLLRQIPGRREEAETILRDLAANSTRCSAARDLAEFLVHSGRDGEAETITAKVTEQGNCYCCLVLHAQICERRGDKLQAEKKFRDAIELAEDGIPALIGLSNLVPAAEAAQFIERAVNSDPSDPSCLLARAKLPQVDLETQHRYATEAISADLDFIEGYLFLARIGAQLGDLDDAIAKLEMALHLLPDEMEHIPGLVATAMVVSEHLSGDRLEQRLAAHPNARSIEPLLVALRLKNGREPLVANEVLEVARDILRKHVQQPA